MEKVTQALSKVKEFLTAYPKLALFLFGFVVGFILGTLF
jgi:hypothetical protein